MLEISFWVTGVSVWVRLTPTLIMLKSWVVTCSEQKMEEGETIGFNSPKMNLSLREHVGKKYADIGPVGTGSV